ncbi:MAG: hypothetical protein P1P81_08185, partial [Desulfobulbales bacterium]|nr:hypothetical protein [Desulfobulbales bacterium]
PLTLVKIADALNDLSILADHCQACPVRRQLFIKQFPDLNNIMDSQPAIILGRLRKEMSEALAATESLAERYSDKDFKNRLGYQEAFESDMEQILDVQRGIEILTHQLIMLGVHSSKDIQQVYRRQQAKCERKGHHRPEKNGGA